MSYLDDIIEKHRNHKPKPRSKRPRSTGLPKLRAGLRYHKTIGMRRATMATHYTTEYERTVDPPNYTSSRARRQPGVSMVSSERHYPKQPNTDGGDPYPSKWRKAEVQYSFRNDAADLPDFV